MKVKLEPGAIQFRMTVEEARCLLKGRALQHSLPLVDGPILRWSAMLTSERTLQLSGLDLKVPRAFLKQELAARRPSKDGLTFQAGENRIGVQVDMRLPKKQDSLVVSDEFS